MSRDEDAYGRRRDNEFLYATVGNGPAPTVPPTPIEQVLLKANLPERDVKETAAGILTLMGRMKDDPLQAQQKMVHNFMGMYATPEAVQHITDMALQQIKPQKVEIDSGVKRPLFEQVERAPAFTSGLKK